MNLIIKVILIYLFILQNTSYAYLDPGTGSNLIQLLIAALAGVGSFMGFYWRKTVIYFKDFKKRLTKKEKKNFEENKK